MKKYIISLTILIAAIFIIYKKVYIPKHTFEIVDSKIGNIPIIVNGVGNVGSENIYKISALYGGKVTNFDIKIGDFIEKGELVAKIDSVDLKDKIAEIKSNIKVITENIDSLKFDKQSAYKNYLYQEEILKKNKKLYDKKAISELEYKKYLTNRDIAKLKVDSLDKKIKSLFNQITQLQSNLAGLKEKLKRYTIISPISGYVIKKHISNFDIISNNQPIIEIVNPKDIWIDTFIDTRISGKVKIGNKAKIKLRSQKEFKGYVYKISPINNNVTNEREIFIKFYKTPIPFYINEQAIINIKIKMLKNINYIPSKAIVFYKQKQGVWVLKDNKAHFEPVKIIAYYKNKVAINSKKTNIIIPNLKKKPLSEGMKIYYD